MKFQRSLRQEFLLQRVHAPIATILQELGVAAIKVDPLEIPRLEQEHTIPISLLIREQRMPLQINYTERSHQLHDLDAISSGHRIELELAIFLNQLIDRQNKQLEQIRLKKMALLSEADLVEDLQKFY